MVFDIGMRDALRHLVNGDAEPLAKLIEQGRTNNLHETLIHYPGAREKLAKALRTGKPLKPREHPWERVRLDQRDWYLCGRVAYWIGRGKDDRWQDYKNDPDGGTVWHLAATEWPEKPKAGYPDVPRPAASSLHKIWLATKRDNDAYRFMFMTHEFCHGVECELSIVSEPNEFLSRQWRKARELGLESLIYTPALMALRP